MPGRRTPRRLARTTVLHGDLLVEAESDELARHPGGVEGGGDRREFVEVDSEAATSTGRVLERDHGCGLGRRRGPGGRVGDGLCHQLAVREPCPCRVVFR